MKCMKNIGLEDPRVRKFIDAVKKNVVPPKELVNFDEKKFMEATLDLVSMIKCPNPNCKIDYPVTLLG